MFFIPIGDDNPTRRTPYVNYALLAINTILFLGLGFTTQYQNLVMHFGFIPDKAVPYTYITSIFLHGSIWHLLGNMLYLFIVGDNVEDKLGHVGYLLFYLFCGALANVFHAAMVSGKMMHIPTIGASGAISAVLGSYMLLFPKNKIKFFYILFIFFFIRWGTFKLASLWAIGAWFIMQLFSHATSGGYTNVAYGAHIGGFIGGVLIVGTLVLVGLIQVHWHKAQDYLDIARENGEITYTSHDRYSDPYEQQFFDRGDRRNNLPPGDDYW